MKSTCLPLLIASFSISITGFASEAPPLPKPCSAKVVFEKGRPRLDLDGQTIFEDFYNTDAGGAIGVLPDLAKAGYRVVSLPVYAGNRIPTLVKPLWLGERQYDWSPLDAHIAKVCSLAPGMKLILNLNLDPPTNWPIAHPEECVAFENEKTAVAKEDVTVWGTKGPSLASEVYIRDVEDFLNELIRHINSQFYRDRIMGFHLVGAFDGQWYHLGLREGKNPDYSEPMRQYFIRLLRNKYRDDPSLLQKAWNNTNAAFDSVVIPSMQRRNGTGDFRDPATEQDVIDYTEAYAKAPMDLIMRFARAIKRATDGRAFVSVYAGSALLDDGNGMQLGGRFLQRELLECPDLDGIVAVTYNQRPLSEPGAPALIDGSFRVHRKLAIQEEDIRTYLATTTYEREPLHGFTPDWDRQRNMLIREFGRVLTSGIGTWQYDMCGRWYSAPEFWDLFGKFQRIGLEELKRDYRSVADLAIVVDDISAIYRPLPDRLLNYNSITMQKTPLGWIGAPYDIYLLDDLFDRKTPKYKCYFFLNTYRVDSKTRERIHTLLRKNNATALWLYAPGIYCDGKLDPGNIEKLTGFAVQRLTNVNSTVTIRKADHPVAQGLAGTSYGTPGAIGKYQPPAFNGGVFYCPLATNGVTVLGDMQPGNAPGLAIRQMDGWTSIYSCGLTFTPQLMRNILRQAGGFLYADDAVTGICADRNYLSVFAKTAGPRKLKLPAPAGLRDALSGALIGTGSEFTVPFKEGEARLFVIEPIR